MRSVLLLNESLVNGGAERQFTLLARNLPASWKPRVWSLGGGRYLGELQEAGIPVRGHDRSWRGDVLPAFDLWEVVREWRPRVIHSYGWMAALAVLPIARLRGVPLADGILGGEGNGPLEPTARPCGCLVLGENLIAVDMVAARLMGFDVGRLQQFSLAQDPSWDFEFRKPQEIQVLYNGGSVSGIGYFSSSFLAPFEFQPPFGWEGQVELNKTSTASAAIPARSGNE